MCSAGEFISGLCSTGAERKTSSMSNADVDYAEEGRKLLEAVNLGSASAPPRYSPCDPIWRHPKSQAKLFVGNAVTASNRQALRDFGITRIVNCQDSDGRNYFEGDPEISYLKFSIGTWRNVPNVRDGAEGTWQFWEPYFKFITESLRDGHSVLVHCLAGAHRAGTAGIAALMLLCNWDVKRAIPAAQALRSAIHPIGGFPELLGLLERCSASKMETYREICGLDASPTSPNSNSGYSAAGSPALAPKDEDAIDKDLAAGVSKVSVTGNGAPGGS